MKSFFANYRFHCLLLGFLFIAVDGFGQSEASRWKGQFAIGVNSPNSSGFVPGFEAKPVNFPTIHLGIQRMFKPQYGVKLDYGFNRIANNSDSPYFKINYSRINAQFVYDATTLMTFLPTHIGIVGHAGPGMSFIKPLSDYANNKNTFFNVMAGIEFHYAITRTFSAYLDTSYIYGVAKEFDSVFDGYGSFNGNLLTVTVGVSISLSGCYFCE